MKCEDEEISKCYQYKTFIWEEPYTSSSLSKIKRVVKNFFEVSHNLRPKRVSNTMTLRYNATTRKYLIGITNKHYGKLTNETIFDGFQIENPTNESDVTNVNSWWCFTNDDDPNCKDVTDIHVPVKKGWAIDNSGHNNIFAYNFNIDTALEEDFLETFLKIWGPECEGKGYQACSYEMLVEGDYPYIEESTGQWVGTTNNSLSTGMKTASFLGYVSDIRSVDTALYPDFGVNYDQMIDFIHYTVSPALYQYSNSSYFNEYEYSASPGVWQRRFWDEDTYYNLLEIKNNVDPDGRLTCRHCIGWDY